MIVFYMVKYWKHKTNNTLNAKAVNQQLTGNSIGTATFSTCI